MKVYEVRVGKYVDGKIVSSRIMRGLAEDAIEASKKAFAQHSDGESLISVKPMYQLDF